MDILSLWDWGTIHRSGNEIFGILVKSKGILQIGLVVDNRKILQKDFSMGIQMPFSGRKSHSGSISPHTTRGILSAFVFSSSKNYPENEQDNIKFYLGWPGWEKEISFVKAIINLTAKKSGRMGSAWPKELQKGPFTQISLERDFRGETME